MTYVLIFLFLANLGSLVRGKWGDFLLVLTSLALGVCLIEALANILEPKASVNKRRSWTDHQPVIGWGPTRAGRFNEAKFDPDTGDNLQDHLHHRCESPASTFGDGVSDAETLPQFFVDAIDRKQRVFNLAFTDYGPQHFLRVLETGHLDKVIGSQQTLFLFLATACMSSELLAYPVGRRMHRAMKSRTAKSSSKVIATRGRACGCGNGPRIQPLIAGLSSLYIRIVIAAVTLAKEKYGVPTLIPYIRVPDEYLRPTGFTDDEIIRRLQDGGAPVLDVSLAQEASGAKITIPGDGHPTPYANRVRALLIKKHIEERLPGILLPTLE